MQRLQRLTNSSAFRIGGLNAAWGTALYLVLQLQHLPIDAKHSICGPWGCGPPLPTLLACHGFWAVLLGVPTLLLCREFPQKLLMRIGNGGLILAVVGLTGVAIWQAATWLPNVSDWQRPYFLQRWLFSVATLVDIPIVQVGVAGLICRMAAGWRDRRERSETLMDEQVEDSTGTQRVLGAATTSVPMPDR